MRMLRAARRATRCGRHLREYSTLSVLYKSLGVTHADVTLDHQNGTLGLSRASAGCGVSVPSGLAFYVISRSSQTGIMVACPGTGQ